MKHLPRTAVALAIAVPALIACSTSTDTPNDPSGETGVTHAAEPHVHDVICGCALDHVGHCSEWIHVDDEYLSLQLPEGMDLGPMPFCGQEGLQAAVSGEVVGDTYVATSFEMQ